MNNRKMLFSNEDLKLQRKEGKSVNINFVTKYDSLRLSKLILFFGGKI